MVDLKCKLVNCKYNKNSNCTAKNIVVNKDINCDTFISQSLSVQNCDKLSMPLLRCNIDVNCNASCLFKKNNKCIANGITMCDESGKLLAASCSTFMPK